MKPWPASYCIAPKCQGEARPDGKFCADHDKAPNVQKGGWISAHQRKLATLFADADQIAPLLWVGAAPPFDRDLPKVDLLVLCAQEIQPERVAFHGRILRCPLPDGPLTHAELVRALAASKTVAKALVDKKRALVTCAMGINRSAFVASLALGRVTTMSADQIIALVRRRRLEQCLGNPHFVGHLQSIIGAGRQQLVGRDRKPSVR